MSTVRSICRNVQEATKDHVVDRSFAAIVGGGWSSKAWEGTATPSAGVTSEPFKREVRGAANEVLRCCRIVDLHAQRPPITHVQLSDRAVTHILGLLFHKSLYNEPHGFSVLEILLPTKIRIP